MTDTNFCCLCASDEGVFLDIFTTTDRQLGNRSFVKEFETCLSVKVVRDEALSTKICHRCAIELGQCNEFVQKYHRAIELTNKPKKSVSKKSCCLCLSTAKNRCHFTLAKDFRSRIDSLQKIYECFNTRITREEAESRLICLLCRYNLDVLYDLRKLAGVVNFKLGKIAESKATLANLSKTKTLVVNRKTTVIYQSKLEVETFSDSDSGGGTMARKRSRSNKVGNQQTPLEFKLRTCGQCHTSIEFGVDMYRLHSTGVTVCKMCWITMDPFKLSGSGKRKRRNQNDAKNTRLCAVFLTDVLSSASSKNNSSVKIEKDEQGNPIYVVSDDSSDFKDKSAVRLKKNIGKQRHRKASTSSEEYGTKLRARLKRSLKDRDVSEDSGSNKKLKSVKPEATTVSSHLRRSCRTQSSDSDSVKAKSKQGDTSNVKNDAGNKAKNSSKLSKDHSGKKLSKAKSNKIARMRKGANTETVKTKSEDSTSSGEGSGRGGRKLRKVRNQVSLTINSELTDRLKSEKNPKRPKPRAPAPTESPTVSKNLNLQSSAKIQSSKTKLSRKRSKALMMVSFPFKLKDPYECKVCRTAYKNRVIGMKHELTHFKKVEIKIEKLNITHHFQNIEENSTTTELPDASCSLDLPSTNEKPLQSEDRNLTSYSGTDEHQSKKSDHETEDGESVQESKRPELTQQDDKSPDLTDVTETDAVSSSNEPLVEEFASEVSGSRTEVAENVEPELSTENSKGLQKDDASSIVTDSAMETKVTNESSVAKVVCDETVDENKREQLSGELDKNVNAEDEEKLAEDKSGKEIEAPLPKTVTNEERKTEKDRDSGEEIESDTDIRIVDSGSSAEDSRERTERNRNDTNTVNNVPEKIEEEAEPKDAEEAQKVNNDSDVKDALTDELEAEVMSTLGSEDNLDKKDESNFGSSQNDEDNLKEHEANELSDKIERGVRPLTAVTEILQEVIDLATAEVQKRVESEAVSIPETLENISEEIKKTAERSVTTDKMLASFEAVTNEETESCKLDPNSTTNSLKNHLDVSTADL